MRKTVMWVTAVLLAWFCSGYTKDSAAVKVALKELSASKGKLENLSVVYDDLHCLHGGLSLEIRGNGTVLQEAVRQEVSPPKKTIDKTGLMALVNILVEQEAWEQRIPKRDSRPYESRAKLTIIHGKDSTVIWEWYNDMEANQRVIKIRELMKDIAWEKKQPSNTIEEASR